MKRENTSNKPFQPHGCTAISQAALDDMTLDAISAGDKDAVKVLLAPIAQALDDFFNLFKI